MLANFLYVKVLLKGILMDINPLTRLIKFPKNCFPTIQLIASLISYLFVDFNTRMESNSRFSFDSNEEKPYLKIHKFKENVKSLGFTFSNQLAESFDSFDSLEKDNNFIFLEDLSNIGEIIKRNEFEKWWNQCHLIMYKTCQNLM